MGEQPLCVMSYAYKPMLPMNAMDGGFSVNLYSNHVLVFSTYDHNGRMTSENCFQLNDYTTSRYLRMVAYARPWLSNLPPYMRDDEGSMDGEYTFGFDGVPLCRVENMQSLIGGHYCNAAAHYARKLYCLMEDISTLLMSYDIDLRLDQFDWGERAPELPPSPHDLYVTYA